MLAACDGKEGAGERDERLCSGAWGKRAARWAENLRRSQDLNHWASFHDSFNQMAELVKGVATGRRGEPPSTVLILSGDVHHGYLAEADFRDTKPLSRVYQAVCSPLRNSLPGKKSRLQSVAWNGGAALATHLLSRLAGVRDPHTDWRLTHDEPFFDNQVATLDLDRSEATITFEGAVLDGWGGPGLRQLYSRRLALATA